MLSIPHLVNWFGAKPSPERVATPAESRRSAPAPERIAPPGPAASTPVVSGAAPAAAPKPASGLTPRPAGAPAKPAAAPAVKSAAAPSKPTATPAVNSAAASKASPEKPAAARARAEEKVAAPPVVQASFAATNEPVKRGDVGTAAKPPSGGAGGGAYWIQVGVFKDQRNADALAGALKSDGVPAQVARVARGGNQGAGAVQQHELLVTGASVDKVNKALKGDGRGQAAPDGVRITPAFKLSDAMAISKRLSDQGYHIIIRPAGDLVLSGAAEGTVYVVRAGGYPDRTAAQAARDALGKKGLAGGLITQGPAK